MLDLEARVHFDEVKVAAFGDELDGAGADIADRARGGHRCFCHGAALRHVEPRRRRLLQHLLMPPLDRAVALEEMHRVAVPIGEDLDFDVPRPRQVFLDQHAAVAKSGLRLALCAGQRRGELRRAIDGPHPAPAAAGRGLDQDRKADPLGLVEQPARVLVVAVVTRD